MVPSAREMAKFAKQFSSTEWKKLCKNQEFLNSITIDLAVSKSLAEKILVVRKPKRKIKRVIDT